MSRSALGRPHVAHPLARQSVTKFAEPKEVASCTPPTTAATLVVETAREYCPSLAASTSREVHAADARGVPRRSERLTLQS
jgi:hypothetical protein